MVEPLPVFISYAHEDAALERELWTHLQGLVQRGVIHCWDDRQTEAGQEWRWTYLGRVRSAGLVLLLISKDSLGSEHCRNEMQEAMERHREGRARVIPVLLRPCAWEREAFQVLTVLPRNLRAVWSHPDRDEVWTEIVSEIESVATRLREANSTLIELVAVPGGRYQMGSADGAEDERPVHLVEISALRLGRYPVTQGQYRVVMETNPAPVGFPADDGLPVNNVSWLDAILFCNRLSARERLRAAYDVRGSSVSWNRQADGYRLPTEAEWEWAARGRDGRPYPWGHEPPSQQLCWGRTSPCRVGSFPAGASPFGLMDMAGNVGEWCWDFYAPYPAIELAENPAGAASGESRVVRGGCFSDVDAAWVSATERIGYEPSKRLDMVGFRCARGTLGR